MTIHIFIEKFLKEKKNLITKASTTLHIPTSYIITLIEDHNLKCADVHFLMHISTK